MAAMRQDCVLIFRLGSIGDTVVALPCFHAIARRYPDARRVLLTNELVSARTSSAQSILDGTGLVDEVIYYPTGDFTVERAMTLRREIRQRRPTTLVYLADRPTAGPVYRDFVFFRLAGIGRIVGLPWTRQLRQCRTDADEGMLEYEAARLARSLGDLGVSLSSGAWDLALSAAELAKARTVLQPIAHRTPVLAVAPGAKVAAKDWGPDNWTALLEALSPLWPGAGLLLVGGRDERTLCDEVACGWRGAVVNSCGELSPRESAAAFRQCELLVCHDSGPMHLAASQGTPCVALFGNYNLPRRWYPFGEGHEVLHEPRGIREIRVPRVVSAIRHIVDSQRARPARTAVA